MHPEDCDDVYETSIKSDYDLKISSPITGDLIRDFLNNSDTDNDDSDAVTDSDQ